MNPTDTNQASEEDQATRMEIHMAMLAKAENAKDAGHATVIKLGFAVSIAEELIRTEKLKLLAEVRERVIGEDLPPDVATDSGVGYSRQQFAINMGKAGQRTKLSKMEAEL